MRIKNVRVSNFRNLANVEVPLQRGTVIVGENTSGKSNFIHAIRLVLDPTLPNSERYLSREDFWEGLSDGTPGWNPMAALERIEISLEFVDFDEEPEALVALAEALVEGDPMVARLTYVYAPREGLGTEAPVYEWQIYGGDQAEVPVPADLRRYVWVSYLQALRDVEGDLGNWNRSPLRALLQSAADAADGDDLAAAAAAIAAAQDGIASLDPVRNLAVAIADRTREIAGERHSLETELGIAPLEPSRLIRGLRIFVDGEAHRPLASASLGTKNVLYLALLELALEQRLERSEIAHVLMAIEEPEAHLHPHLQRLTFGRLLKDDHATRTVIVTTHSPHIASAADPRGLVVFRGEVGQASARAASNADLTDSEWSDIERYLDATRAEMVFARRVLLVEGFAEQVLMPALAQSLDIDLDKSGVSVCSVHGTHFSSYIRFLEALGIPWAVVTDGDRTPKGDLAGERRAAKLLDMLGHEGPPAEAGIFVGDSTFEFDLFRASAPNQRKIRQSIRGLSPTKRTRDRMNAWRAEAPEYEKFIPVVERVGKGRLAQRLAGAQLSAPPYVSDALEWLTSE